MVHLTCVYRRKERTMLLEEGRVPARKIGATQRGKRHVTNVKKAKKTAVIQSFLAKGIAASIERERERDHLVKKSISPICSARYDIFIQRRLLSTPHRENVVTPWRSIDLVASLLVCRAFVLSTIFLSKGSIAACIVRFDRTIPHPKKTVDKFMATYYK